MKSCAYPEKFEVKLRSASSLRRKERAPKILNSAMSTKTKDFIQKICYRKTASIDMTQYGFINDSKFQPVNLLMKPLRAQLERICGPKHSKAEILPRNNSAVRKKVKLSPPTTSPNQRSPRRSSSPKGRKSPRKPSSAQSSTGTHSPRSRARKVKKQTQPEPLTEKKKVRVKLPKAKKK